MAEKNDTELPSWNFWRHFPNGEFRFDLDYKNFEEADLRSPKAHADPIVWARKYFWTAEQASLLAFGLDPERIDWEDYCVDPEGQEVRDLLYEYCKKFASLLRSDQDAARLPSDPIPAGVLLAWAETHRVTFPHWIVAQVETILSPQSIQVADTEEPRTTEPRDAGKTNRVDRNVKKIILAFLRRGKTKDSRVDIPLQSKQLSQTLSELAVDSGDDSLKLGEQTIRERLNEAEDLVK